MILCSIATVAIVQNREPPEQRTQNKQAPNHRTAEPQNRLLKIEDRRWKIEERQTPRRYPLSSILISSLFHPFTRSPAHLLTCSPLHLVIVPRAPESPACQGS